MTGELKKRFIDILFEDDISDEELEDEAVQDAKNEKSAAKKTESVISAKDILYHKSGSSAFINLNEISGVTSKNVEPKKEEYEMSSQISPMFGLIKDNKKKANTPVKPEITESQTNKPSDSHLDIITSPIYGYGNKEDAQDNNYNVKGITSENEEEELHYLFDEDEYLNDSYENMNKQKNNDEEISLFRLFGENR